MKRIIAGIACCMLFGQFAQSQSVYSFQGLGSLNHQGMPNNVAQGEVGIGSPTIWHINSQNPANLIYNTFSTFQLGLMVDQRSFSGNDISGEGISGSATDGGLRFLGYSFPIMPGKWSSSFGILPYSSVNYNTFSDTDVPGTNGETKQRSDNRGEGGLTSLFWSNGFKIKDNFNVGIKASYVFGSISKESTIILYEDRRILVDGDSIDVQIQVANPVQYSQLQSYSDFNFLFGMSYRHKITDERFLNFGAVFSPKSPMNGNSELTLVRLSSSGSELGVPVDVGSRKIEFDLPRMVGFGASYQKLNHYTIGADFEFSGWSNAGSPETLYNNSFKIAVGGEFTPDYDNINTYWKRVKYAGGFNYQKLPYIVNDQALIDFGINFGASLPVSGFSSLDLAFKWGQLGKSSNGLIKETYYKIVIGTTMNDRWFIKRKYD
ncbi:hypothetical protein [Ekhidna sp.]|uniref:hypothetical protein n=1 Tax=Ekhidna sp. TaxID=2608089 RepID=UPI003B510025